MTWRPLLPLLGLLVAATLAVPVARIGLADALVATDPEQALRWSPRHRGALEWRGQDALNRNDWSALAPTAAALLANSPLSGHAYRLLAHAAEHGGDMAQAGRLFAVAARRAPRDRVAHGWLATQHALYGRFAAAIDELDTLLRIAPGLFGEVAPSLAAFVSIGEARTALVHRLATQDPPWRARFLAWFAGQPEASSLLAALFGPLREAAHPLTPPERSAWLERLLRDGAVAQAYYLWIDGLPTERRAVVGNVFDGGFEWPADNSGFGWRLGSVPGASIQFEAVAGASDRQALSINFHDRRVAFAHVQQRLALPAGRYALRGRVRLDGLRNERGLVWQVQCDDGRMIAQSTRFLGSSAWRDFETSFERPPERCAGQSLVLRLDARIAPERMIGGRALFDDLRIVSID